MPVLLRSGCALGPDDCVFIPDDCTFVPDDCTFVGLANRFLPMSVTRTDNGLLAMCNLCSVTRLLSMRIDRSAGCLLLRSIPKSNLALIATIPSVCGTRTCNLTTMILTAWRDSCISFAERNRFILPGSYLGAVCRLRVCSRIAFASHVRAASVAGVPSVSSRMADVYRYIRAGRVMRVVNTVMRVVNADRRTTIPMMVPVRVAIVWVSKIAVMVDVETV